MSGVAVQQLSERRHADNPIVHIEELRRFPLRGARVPPAGTAFVFRARSGSLRCPAGGYTAGEMLWRGPLVLFQVDLAPHVLRLRWELPVSPERHRVVAEVTGRWVVRDPVAVVQQRVADAAAVCLAAVQQRTAVTPARPPDPGALKSALRDRLGTTLDLPEGLRADQLRLDLSWQPRHDADALVRALLAGEEDPAQSTDEAVAENWHSDAELARSGLAAFAAGVPDEHQRHTVDAALQRFAEMTERLARHLPRQSDGDGIGHR